MEYIVIIEYDQTIYWANERYDVEWGFGSLDEAKDRVEDLRAENDDDTDITYKTALIES